MACIDSLCVATLEAQEITTKSLYRLPRAIYYLYSVDRPLRELPYGETTNKRQRYRACVLRRGIARALDYERLSIITSFMGSVYGIFVAQRMSVQVHKNM